MKKALMAAGYVQPSGTIIIVFSHDRSQVVSVLSFIKHSR
jgi:hypothetical protein